MWWNNDQEISKFHGSHKFTGPRSSRKKQSKNHIKSNYISLGNCPFHLNTQISNVSLKLVQSMFLKNIFTGSIFMSLFLIPNSVYLCLLSFLKKSGRSLPPLTAPDSRRDRKPEKIYNPSTTRINNYYTHKTKQKDKTV